MGIDLGSLAVGAAEGIANGAMSLFGGASSAHYQRKNFRANADYLHQINISDAKNKYLYELEALRNAGVNTAMIGGGVSSAGVSSSSGAPADAPDMGRGSFDLTGALQKGAQIKQSESAVELNKSTSQAQSAKARLDNAEAQRLEMTQSLYYRQMYSSLQQTAEGTRQIQSMTEYNKQLRDNASFDLFSRQMMLDDTLRNLQLTNDELDAKIREISANISIRQQELPLNLQLLRAKAFEAYQAGNLSKEQMVVCQRTCALLKEQADNISLDNRYSRETLDGRISLANAVNNNDYSEELIRDVKLHRFFEDPEKLASMADAEFNKLFYQTLFDGYIADGDWNARTAMKYLRRADMVTKTVGNVMGLNLGYGSFKSTNLNHNMTPNVKSSVMMPTQGGSFDLYQAQQLLNPWGK